MSNPYNLQIITHLEIKGHQKLISSYGRKRLRSLGLKQAHFQKSLEHIEELHLVLGYNLLDEVHQTQFEGLVNLHGLSYQFLSALCN